MRFKRFVAMLCTAFAFCMPVSAQQGTKNLVNDSGAAVTQYAVVVGGTTVNSTFSTTTTADDNQVVGVVLDASVSNGVAGLIATTGVTKVQVTGAVARGDFLGTHTVAGKAISNGTDPSGSFGFALEAGTDTTVRCMLMTPQGANPASSMRLNDDKEIQFGDAQEIRLDYDNATNKLEFTDGTNILATLTDAGTTGNFAATGTLIATGGITGTPISGSTGAFTTLSSSGLTTANSLTVTNDLLVDGGDIGITADTDLLGLASGALTVRGTLTATGAMTAQSTLEVTADTTVGTNAGTTRYLILNSAQSNARHILYQTAGVLRWQLGANSTAESGGNAGSNYTLTAYGDTGTFIDQPIFIERVAGGTMTLSRPVTMTGDLAVNGGDLGITADPNLIGLAADALTVNGALTTTGNGWYSNGVLTIGTANASRGALTLNNGSGTTTPGYIALKSLSGTATGYLWVAADGKLRIHTAVPTADTDGVVVGAQT